MATARDAARARAVIPALLVPSVRPRALIRGTPLGYAGDTRQMTLRQYLIGGGFTDSNTGVSWSSSNPSAVTVSGAGLITFVTSGTATITASVGGLSYTATATQPVTAQDYVTGFNAIDPAVQIQHAWAPGYGHTTTLGRKTAIVDFVAGGADGALTLVPSFVGANGSGIKYDPATPDRFLWDTSSMRVVAAHDLDLSVSRSFGFIGTMNDDACYFLQSHDGAGNNGGFCQFFEGSPSTFAIGVPGGSPNTGRSAGVLKDGHVFHSVLQWDSVGDGSNPEVQMIVGRDARAWAGDGHAGSSAGCTGTRTLEVGNYFGGGAGNNQTGDFRLLYVHTGTQGAAHIRFANGYAEQRCGTYIDTRPVACDNGNSIVAEGNGQWAKQERALLTPTAWVTMDLGWPGAGWTQLTARSARVEALLDFRNRTKTILSQYEWTNSENIITYPTGAAFYAAAKAAFQSVFATQLAANVGGIKKLGITMLPSVEHYVYNTADGITANGIRLAAAAAMVADPYWNAVYDAANDATMGPYAATQNATLYTDGVHPNTSTGTPIIATGKKNKDLTL